MRKLALFEDLVETTRGDIQHLVLQAASFLKALPYLTEYSGIQTPELPEALEFLDRPLVHSVLRRALLSDSDLELVFTKLRQTYLECTDMPVEHRGLIASLAAQCFNNNYAWLATRSERQRLDDLMMKDVVSVDEIMILAMYRPLALLPEAVWKPHLDCYDPDFSYLLSKQIREPAIELELQQTLPSLGPIDDVTSKRVAEQYQQNPYPRWFSIPPQTSELLSERMHLWCSNAYSSNSDDILVAGCGTGQHPVHLAGSFPHSRVVAMDLSHASLAYGKRRCQDFGIDNLEFWHGDILALHNKPEWRARFGFVDAVGVLHHLQSPLEGCRALCSMMAPGGVLRVGLYSALARREAGVDEARSLWVGQPEPRSEIQLQKSRRRLLGSGLTRFLDFYALNGFRDLMFPAQETRFTILEAVEMLREVGLSVVCLQVTERVQKRFLADNARSSLTDWQAWDRYEQQHLSTFVGMYNFLAVAA